MAQFRMLLNFNILNLVGVLGAVWQWDAGANVFHMTKPPEGILQLNAQKQRAAQAKLINHIAQVYFFFAEENEDFDNDTDIDEFIDFMWDIAVLTAASLGMKVIGETEDGRIIAELKPSKSVKEFMKKTEIGTEEQLYWEDIEEVPYDYSDGEVDWGEWSEVFS